MQNIQTVCPTNLVDTVMVTLCVIVGGSVIGVSIVFGLMEIGRGIYKFLTES